MKVILVCLLGIYKIEKEKKPEAAAPKRRGRGAVRAEGVQDFDPDSNIRIDRKSEAVAK